MKHQVEKAVDNWIKHVERMPSKYMGAMAWGFLMILLEHDLRKAEGE